MVRCQALVPVTPLRGGCGQSAPPPHPSLHGTSNRWGRVPDPQRGPPCRPPPPPVHVVSCGKGGQNRQAQGGLRGHSWITSARARPGTECMQVHRGGWGLANFGGHVRRTQGRPSVSNLLCRIGRVGGWAGRVRPCVAQPLGGGPPSGVAGLSTTAAGGPTLRQPAAAPPRTTLGAGGPHRPGLPRQCRGQSSHRGGGSRPRFAFLSDLEGGRAHDQCCCDADKPASLL